MSQNHEYHQPNAPDANPSDPESDIEVDLQELDPIDGPGFTHYDQPSTKTRRRDPGGVIPLRNLRTRALRGFGRRSRKHDDALRQEQENGEDLQELLQDSLNTQDSSGSTEPEDGAPLLPNKTFLPTRRSYSQGRRSRMPSQIRLPKFITGGSEYLRSQNRDWTTPQIEPEVTGTTRSIRIGEYPLPRFPPNSISNAKYTPWSFLPRTLYNEFSFFFNMYFLLVALSQLIPPLRIGFISTYIAPLAFVLFISLGKEALDDIARRRRDNEANKEEYVVLRFTDNGVGHQKAGRKGKRKKTKMKNRERSPIEGRLDAIAEEERNIEGLSPSQGSNLEVDEIKVKSRDLKVGHILKLCKDQRIPADSIILKSYTAESVIVPKGKQIEYTESSSQPDLIGHSLDRIAVADGTGTALTTKELVSTGLSGSSQDGNGIGEAFIRTDQLDGETDWKLRLASPLVQTLDPHDFTRLTVVAGKPDRKVNEFVGTVELSPRPKSPKKDVTIGSGDAVPGQDQKIMTAPLTIDNTAWANTILASSATVLALVVYTGVETRQALSTSSSRSKTGLLDCEINNLTKILCALTLILSVVLVGLEGFNSREGQPWYVAITRFLILFSTIIPISLRVNLDMGKSVYAWFIEKDPGMPGAVVRTSTIPEDLGRIEYLLSDKTGTLTQNEMVLKKIHVGTVSYANEAMDEISAYVRQGFSSASSIDASQPTVLVTPSTMYNVGSTITRTRREIGSRVRDIVLALALCHNVTPTAEMEGGQNITTYQASSPDEIAIVRWTESVGLRVIHRDRHSIALQSVDTSRITVRVKILEVFPFASEGKRMGIILQFLQGSETTTEVSTTRGEIWFYQKGADTVMTSIVAANDWLDEETANMAREGLRTLVVGRRRLSQQQYQEFSTRYGEASMSFQSRDSNMAQVIHEHLERNLELLGVTGVEDKLQQDVKPSLELLRNAGIKIWMLTGDKVETARCVAVSAKLVSRSQHIHTITKLPSLVRTQPTAAADALSLLNSNPDSTALLIDGDSLSYLLSHHRTSFITTAVLLPAVIACRCSPTQKADIALLIRTHTNKRIACIGDGGNDVSMIQAADVGVGIVGKEGRQASLAADFSITQFHHLTKLLLWHGRNSYKRSAKLAQFVIHRGLVISVAQTVYSIATHFEPHALYRDWLLVGYATVYTMMPVFSLVLDKDVDEHLANLYPELYRELTPGTSLSYETFFVWLLVSIYQGTIIQGLSQILVGSVDSPRMVSVSFTTLVINELVMVAFEITTWHWIMIASLLGTFAIYAGSVPFLGDYFDLSYVWSWGFVWRVAAIAAISLVPPYCVKVLRRTLRPPSYRKVRGV